VGMTDVHKNLVGKNENKSLGDLVVDGMIILK
jgi:hypothetical protein